MSRFGRLVREPLVHFALLGAAVFALFSLGDAERTRAPDAIVVTTGRIEHLITGFTRAWQRPPTEEEVRGLIDDWIREEVYCREAIAMDLDRDDPIVRRRLRQKLEFVAEDLAAQVEPTDADVQAYWAEHAESFRPPARLSFAHVYLNADRRGPELERDAQALLEQLRQRPEADPAELGDPFLLPHRFAAITDGEVRATFGDRFAADLARLPPGIWHGPLRSGYGAHLVLLLEHVPGATPELALVRDAVSSALQAERARAAQEAFYQGLLRRHTVEIEALPRADPSASAEVGR